MNNIHEVGIQFFAGHQMSPGVSIRNLEEVSHTSFKQIIKWVYRFEAEAIEGLMDKSGRGRKSRLSNEQEEKEHNIILDKSTIDFEFNTEI